MLRQCVLARTGGRAAGAAIGRHARLTAGIALAAGLLCGCASMNTPQRLYSVDEEFAGIKQGIESADFTGLSDKDKRLRRNQIIAARKYAIDLQYTHYESALTQEIQAIDMGSKAASIALDQAAILVPVTHTKDLLNGISTGVSGLDLAYNDKVLRTKMIENVESSMRTGRHERAAIIFANMRCSFKTYPMAMALSDLEAYYRAGTFAAGLMKLSQTVSEKETNSGAAADAQKPNGTDGQAKLAALATEAAIKADAAGVPAAPGQPAKKKSAHKCTAADFDES